MQLALAQRRLSKPWYALLQDDALAPLGQMVSDANLRSADIKAGCGKCGACSSLSIYET